jgi:hypothetical protein
MTEPEQEQTILPVLVATDPVTRPAVVYDRWWLQSLIVQAPTPTGEATATVILARYSSADGSLSGETTTITLPDLFGRLGDDYTLASAMAGIVQVVQRIAAEKGLVQP